MSIKNTLKTTLQSRALSLRAQASHTQKKSDTDELQEALDRVVILWSFLDEERVHLTLVVLLMIEKEQIQGDRFLRPGRQ